MQKKHHIILKINEKDGDGWSLPKLLYANHHIKIVKFFKEYADEHKFTIIYFLMVIIIHI